MLFNQIWTRNFTWIQRWQSSSVVSPKKPQISAPTIGIPKIPKFKMVGMEYAKSFHDAALSPVQWAVYLPELINVDRLRTNGLLPVIFIKALLVALDSNSPYKLCALYSVILP